MGTYNIRAEDGTRTRDPDLGKVVLYQLSYFRIALLSSGAERFRPRLRLQRYVIFCNRQIFAIEN